MNSLVMDIFDRYQGPGTACSDHNALYPEPSAALKTMVLQRIQEGGKDFTDIFATELGQEWRRATTTVCDCAK